MLVGLGEYQSDDILSLCDMPDMEGAVIGDLFCQKRMFSRGEWDIPRYCEALKKKGKEPSTPKKIGIGMGIAALGFIVMVLGSLGLPNKSELATMSTSAIDAIRVSPFLLIGTYFVLTVAELFISPLGLSFVSKVAPPHLQGIMQGAWLAATAVGNSLLFVGGILYTNVPMWGTWLVFVIATAVSMIVMLAMVKWLERVAK